MSWVMQTDGTIINTDNTVWADKTLTAPYPANIWRITEGTNDGKPYHLLLPDDAEMGAFCHCTNLSRVSIPDSVKQIGMYSFTNTALKNVKIASDCEYYPTSFPDDCIVSGGLWDTLADADGNPIADKAGRQIYVRRAE